MSYLGITSGLGTSVRQKSADLLCGPIRVGGYKKSPELWLMIAIVAQAFLLCGIHVFGQAESNSAWPDPLISLNGVPIHEAAQ